MDYLQDYIKGRDFGDKMSDLNDKRRNGDFHAAMEYDMYNTQYQKHFKEVMEKFNTLGIVIYDFQFMVKKNGDGVKIIDFGMANKLE